MSGLQLESQVNFGDILSTGGIRGEVFRAIFDIQSIRSDPILEEVFGEDFIQSLQELGDNALVVEVTNFEQNDESYGKSQSNIFK